MWICTTSRKKSASISPYSKMPVLVERDLVLTESNIINEYIDERFPHPQLMPPDPVMRATCTPGAVHFEQDLFTHLPNRWSNQKAADKARRKFVTACPSWRPSLPSRNT